jgi:hypothetical protein
VRIANGGWRITIEVKTLGREIWLGIIEVSDVVRSRGELKG